MRQLYAARCFVTNRLYLSTRKAVKKYFWLHIIFIILAYFVPAKTAKLYFSTMLDILISNLGKLFFTVVGAVIGIGVTEIKRKIDEKRQLKEARLLLLQYLYAIKVKSETLFTHYEVVWKRINWNTFEYKRLSQVLSYDTNILSSFNQTVYLKLFGPIYYCGALIQIKEIVEHVSTNLPENLWKDYTRYYFELAKENDSARQSTVKTEYLDIISECKGRLKDELLPKVDLLIKKLEENS